MVKMRNNNQHELIEAKNQAELVLNLIDQALGKLNTAKNWGIYDIFSGGIFSSMMKRGKLRDVNDLLDDIDHELYKLNGELDDIEEWSIDGFSVNTASEFLDVWLDNIFTDISVQNDIQKVHQQLEELATQIDDLANRLLYELNKK